MPVIGSLVFYKEIKSEKALSLIPFYSLLFLTCNIFNLSGLVSADNNNFFYGFITLHEYVLFSYFLFLSNNNKNARRLIIYFSMAFVVFLFIYIPTAEFKRIDSIPIGMETLLILTYSFYYLFVQMNNSRVLFIYNQYQFWIVVGMMLYLSGSFFLYIFANLLPTEQVRKYWFIIDIFLIIKNIAFTIAILVFALQPRKKTPQYRTLNMI